MKETLRKKSTRSDSTSEIDNPSTTSEAPSNPWASESSSAANGEPISRQTSKSFKTPETGSPIRPTAQEKSSSSSPPPPPRSTTPATLEVNGGENGTDKPTRRRKTITKTPHTFELEVDLNPMKKEQQPPPPTPEVPRTETPASTPAPKKKKKAAQNPPPETPKSITVVNAVPSIQSTPATPTSPKPVSVPPSQTSTPSATAVQPPPTPASNGPTSPKPALPTPAAHPFTNTHRPKKSLSSSTAVTTSSNPCRFTPPLLPDESFHGKVVVLTNGASQTGQALIRQFHAAGSRVIFGDKSSDQARKLISSLPPPHVVHFNKCDMTRYSDMLELFKLATTMYGRVDHAIFGVGDDGGHARSVAEAERGWFDHDRPGMNKTFRMAVSEIEREPYGLGETLTAATRFARIAMAYLKYSPKAKQKPKIVNPYSSPRPDETVGGGPPGKDDRSLTFVTSVAAFKETPGLPIYQISQHGILGLVRSLRSAVDPDPERDGVRINAVVTNVMVPRALAQSGGRMSVQLPPDRPEDVARVVAGVVATSSANAVVTEGTETGITNGGGIWYERGFERGVRERFLHGRVIYGVGTECWDVQEGLDRSESLWIGSKPVEAMMKGFGTTTTTTGAGQNDGSSSWILDLA
ncbi:uncharacterized protein PV06_02440 [Exophiala oligosperma]|uniref:Uncharacterized protein n=2 Tax=Chaetothyriales TaxID=34395 RepID=A0A0D2EFT8_9EURO|nr:uncharacterized protein PV06_02440 [Exophiala oligosperma]KAJ9640710.1 hypothetical protein H2204_003339 [Knufia peltigerae]KIW46804.1 hypothetical protein PV06_02440 [Exophiala oligosperma]